MSIDLTHVSWGVRGRTIVQDVSAVIGDREVVGLVGPNGSGKSSLLRCVVGLRMPSNGTVHLDGVDVHGLAPRHRAQVVAFVEQEVDVTEDLRLRDVVTLGRAPYVDRWRGPRSDDERVVADAMTQVGVEHLADRRWGQLSGGERQRAHLARAIAQQTPTIVLDEPTNHLDIRHQIELMEHLRACGATILVSLHDLGLAGRYCDRILLMESGRLVAAGSPAEVLNPELIRRSFGVDADVTARSDGTWAMSYAAHR